MIKIRSSSSRRRVPLTRSQMAFILGVFGKVVIIRSPSALNTSPNAAQTAKRHPDFAPGYEALARRRGRKIATTVVARKLITRAYHLLTDAASAGAPS
jgi:hypothetical protein